MADRYIAFRFENPLNLTSYVASVLDNNTPGFYDFFGGASPGRGMDVSMWFDSSNETYEGTTRDILLVPIQYPHKIYLRNGSDVASNNFTICNHNGICEPCNRTGCFVVENHLSCPDDCGPADNYCDNRKDGKCDPDCEEIDPDCHRSYFIPAVALLFGATALAWFISTKKS